MSKPASRDRWLSAGLVAMFVVVVASSSSLHADGRARDRKSSDAASALTQREKAPASTTQESNVAGPTIGPDVIVSVIDGEHQYTDDGPITGLHSYSVGTTSCNIGDMEAIWIDNTNQHPVIAQTMYRYDAGRFEQIAQSWLKHGFCAVNGGTLCLVCQPTDPICPSLGIGCSDTYSPTLNGNPPYLGPKYQVNPYTGAFTFPHPTPEGPNKLRGRMLARVIDIDPVLNPNARYYVQAQYITTDEPAWGNIYNNCSYRRVNFAEDTMVLDCQGPTITEAPAIVQWASLQTGVEIDIIDVPGDGRLYLASRVTQVDSSTWNYEYAVFNMNCDRAIGWLRLPVEPGAAVSAIGFHDVDYHSGEPYSNEDWDVLETYAAVTWATEPYAVNVNANALRWGTLYNFRLTSNVGPTEGEIVLGLFKPVSTAGASPTISVNAPVPGVVGAVCLADTVSGKTFQPPPDGVVDGADLASLLSWWGAFPGAPADLVDSSTFNPPPDGVVDGADLAVLLSAWGECE